MNNKILTLIAALALVGAPMLAISALADGNETDNDHDSDYEYDGQSDEPRKRGEDARARHDEMKQERDERRADFQKENEERRADIHSDISDHRACVDAVLADARANRHTDASGNGTSNNTTSDQASHVRLALKECNEDFREDMKENHERAKQHHLAAKAHMKAKYEARLLDARADYRNDHRDSDECRQSEECIERHIEKLETKKNRTLELQAKMQDRLAIVEAKLADAEANGNETFHLEDAKLALQIKILKIDRLVLHIDAKLEKMYQALEDLQFDDAATTSDAASDVETDDDVEDVEAGDQPSEDDSGNGNETTA